MNVSLLKTPLRQVGNVKDLLMNQQARDQLSMVAAKHMNPERMMRVMANAVRTTPKLGQCEPMSLLGGLMQCAALGLEPNTILGHAYLIPFENNSKKITEVQLVVGYKGLIDLARRSGHITSISANIHYSDDELWEYEEGTEARLRHRPGSQDGEKLHAYAIAAFKDGGHAYVVMPWKQVIKIRDGSQGYKTAVRYGKTASSPWGSHEDAMAKKTAIRALAKYLPLSVEFSDAVALDESRADYGAFAINPTEGLTIEGDVVDADGVVQEQIDEQPKQRATRQAKAEPRSTTRRDTGAYVDGAKGLDQKTAEAEGESAPESSENSQTAEPDFADNAWGKTFLSDVTDLGFDQAYDLHEAHADQMKAERPEFFAWLMDQVAKIGAQ